MDEKKLEDTLNQGYAWMAHGDRPDQDGRKVGVTITLKKLSQGSYHVGIDTYFIEGVYGTDISWEQQQFKGVAPALKFIEVTTGISRESLKRQIRPDKLNENVLRKLSGPTQE